MSNAPFFNYGASTRRLHDAWFSENSIRSDEKLSFPNDSSKVGDASGNFPGDVADARGLSIDVLMNQCRSTVKQRQLINQIRSKFHKIDLYPTESQVYEMIQFASRCSRRRTLNSLQPKSSMDSEHQIETGITFGEFCFFASVLINNAKTHTSRPLVANHALHRHLERLQASSIYHQNLRNNHTDHKSLKHIGVHRSSLADQSNNCTKFDIFLGGSCNPTRWRFDLVMPELKKNCITYYNPQVDNWGPELIELESYAKQNSEVLFFVIDNQTRAIASMIEVAFVAASRRKLILVINDLDQWSEDICVSDDLIPKDEYETLRKGRQYLRDIVERQGIPIFNQIPKALRSVIRVLREKVWPQDLLASDDVVPVKNGHVSLGDKMIEIYHVYDQSKNPLTREFTFAELPFAYRMLAQYEIPNFFVEKMARFHCRKKLMFENSEENSKLPPLDEIPIDFHDFCIIISELAINYFKTTQSEQISQKNSNDSESSGSSQNSLATGSETDSDCFDKSLRKTKKRKYDKSIKISSNIEEMSFSNRIFEKMATLINVVKSFVIKADTTKPRLFLDGDEKSHSKFKSRNGKAQYDHHTHTDKFVENPPFSNHLGCDSSLERNHHSRKFKSYKSIRPSQSLNQLNESNWNSINHHQSIRNSPFRKSSSPRGFISSLAYETTSSSRRHYHYPSNQMPELQMISSSSQSSITSLLYENVYDLYIGGSLDKTLMQETIIPLLKKNSITFCLPKFSKFANYERMIPLEALHIEKCRQLLFVIPEDSIDISFMIIAAHYVGLGYRVILCIQYINPKSEFAQKLSSTAIKDYNRGRSYLSDMATKSHVPVFEDLDEAVKCCIEFCKQE
ncbi:hypothetical protein SSS_04341 [Sarcoptes scabiei]|uniref:Uncharacterized protein n=1 Tax=Sarcoptes scabiei TaxID=52283 RepID=A0A834VEB4_SARSC|nr:hypothetical protein SSS_04341 [Sarcoptes scabiei]